MMAKKVLIAEDEQVLRESLADLRSRRFAAAVHHEHLVPDVALLAGQVIQTLEDVGCAVDGSNDDGNLDLVAHYCASIRLPGELRSVPNDR